MKNKGETLIESLISMFFIVIVLVPISNIFLKTFRTNLKIDNKNSENLENKNLLEILKIKDYKELEKIIGNHEFKGKNIFYNILNIDEEYRVLKENKEEKVKKLEVKRTNSFYINNNGEKEYILELKIDNIKSYYFPR